MTSRSRSAGFVLVTLLACSIVASACVMQRNPLSGRSRAYGYTWQQEIRLGTDADVQIQAEYGLYDDPALTAWVDSIGQALLSLSHLRRPDAAEEFRATPFHFRVLDSPVVNAFALPGGYVYVTRGLLAHVENEAQLAVVLGHEIGHVAGRHGSKRAASQMLGQALLIGGAVGGGLLFGDEVASAVLNLGSSAAQLLFLSYGRDDERESDALGVEYASLAGYDAAQGAAFFGTLRRLGEQSGQSLPGFLSTHPDPGEREITVGRLAGEWAARVPSTDRIGRDRLLGAVSGLVAGENPRAGFVRADVFLHPDLALQYPVPSGFRVVNQASRVVMVAPQENAYLLFALDAAATSREAAEAFSRTQGLTVLQSGIGSSNGLPANFVLAETASEDGSMIRVRAHFVDYGGRVYAFTGIAAERDYATWEPVFLRSMHGFGPLRDNAVLSMQPARVHVARVDRPSTLRALAAAPGGGFTPEGIAILNQRGLDETLPAGSAVKLVR